MDKIWDSNPSKSEIIGRCGGDEKNERPRRTDKSRTLKFFNTQTELSNRWIGLSCYYDTV